MHHRVRAGSIGGMTRLHGGKDFARISPVLPGRIRRKLDDAADCPGRPRFQMHRTINRVGITGQVSRRSCRLPQISGSQSRHCFEI